MTPSNEAAHPPQGSDAFATARGKRGSRARIRGRRPEPTQLGYAAIGDLATLVHHNHPIACPSTSASACEDKSTIAPLRRKSRMMS